MTLFFGDLLPYAPLLMTGLGISLYITVVTMIAGGLLGIALYRGKVGQARIPRAISIGYIEAFRNTPLLVQLYLIYFGLPQFGINLNPEWSALIALTLNNAAYMAEIYRAGFEAVPKGLIEAGRALGMHANQIFRNVQLMPAIRNVFPALTNQLILLFLASSVTSIIALPELMNTITNISSRTFRTIEILTVGGLIYFVFSALFAVGSRYVDAKLFRWAATSNV